MCLTGYVLLVVPTYVYAPPTYSPTSLFLGHISVLPQKQPEIEDMHFHIKKSRERASVKYAQKIVSDRVEQGEEGGVIFCGFDREDGFHFRIDSTRLFFTHREPTFWFFLGLIGPKTANVR